MGKPAPIAAGYGIDPLLFLVGATTLPKTESEYEYYSGIKGSPIELFTSDLTGLPLPAHAEIILEGYLYPDETFAEGPVRRVHRLLRTAERRDALHACRARPPPQQPDADLRADGRWAVERVRAVLGRGALQTGIWADLQKLGVQFVQVRLDLFEGPTVRGWTDISSDRP